MRIEPDLKGLMGFKVGTFEIPDAFHSASDIINTELTGIGYSIKRISEHIGGHRFGGR